MGKVKDKVINVITNKKFGRVYAIGMGAIMCGLIYGIGENIGFLDGMKTTNGWWEDAIKKLNDDIEKEKSESED